MTPHTPISELTLDERCDLVADIMCRVLRDEGECAIWWGPISRYGYPETTVRGRKCRVHRLLYQLCHGVELPDNVVVMHSCDRRDCVALHHLSAGTQSDNTKDRDRKGRTARGQHAGAAKLTDAEAQEIRDAYERGDVTQTELADLFGVSQKAIFMVVHGLTYKQDPSHG